jgi:hypothetical protein
VKYRIKLQYSINVHTWNINDYFAVDELHHSVKATVDLWKLTIYFLLQNGDLLILVIFSYIDNLALNDRLIAKYVEISSCELFQGTQPALL